MDINSIGMIAIAAVLLSKMWSAQPVDSSSDAPSYEKVIDVTRWRHDGSQPVTWSKGNGGTFPDYTVQRMM